ncbi:MAG: thioredoxin domain-containing protein [Aureliella sp.]
MSFLLMTILGCSSNDQQRDEGVSLYGASPVQLTDDNFELEVIRCDIPVLVDMWAAWCEPCIEMKPTLRLLAKELAGRVKVAELNVDDNAFIAGKYDINRYPTLLIFRDGKEVVRLIGSQTRESLLENILNEKGR